MDYMEVFERHVELINKRTYAEEIHTVLHPDVLFIDAADREFRGRDAYVKQKQILVEMMPDVQYEILGYEGDANGGLLTLRIEGHFMGHLRTNNGCIPPTGRHVVCDVWANVKVTDGLISYWKSTADVQDFLRQAGLG